MTQSHKTEFHTMCTYMYKIYGMYCTRSTLYLEPWDTLDSMSRNLQYRSYRVLGVLDTLP